LFACNEQHSDYIALYLNMGRLHFSFNSGSGQLILKGSRNILDGNWHTIRVEREGRSGTLVVDEVVEANGETPPGTDAVDTKAPFYVGGLPSDLVPLASRLMPNTRAEFGGCLRDFKLNDRKFDAPSRSIGTVPCGQSDETGIFFGDEGGYVVLDKELAISTSFHIELDIKPRVHTAVLLSVGALNYLNLEMHNGSIKFAIDTGSASESIIFTPPMNNSLCDGHWHSVKVNKKKNLMWLTVDGKSNVVTMKKDKGKGAQMAMNTKDPLYLGGVPKGSKPRGLQTTDNYVGCVRIVNVGHKMRRRRKHLKPADLSAVGDVELNKCPVN